MMAARRNPIGIAVVTALLAAALLVPDPASAAPPPQDPAAEAATGGGSVRSLLQQARAASDRGDVEAALETVRQALQLAPSSETVLNAHAELSLAARAPVPAILSLEPLTRMHPSVARYHYLLGVARMQIADMAGAAEALRRAVELEPRDALSLVALGLALNGQKHYEDAIEALTAALQLDPDSVEALAALADANQGLGRTAAAEELARRALARRPEHPTANLVLGMALLEQRRHPEARDVLQAAVAADSTSPKAHYQLSLALARLGDEAASRRHLELYRRSLESMEERLRRLRSQVGLQGAGMGELPAVER